MIVQKLTVVITFHKEDIGARQLAVVFRDNCISKIFKKAKEANLALLIRQATFTPMTPSAKATLPRY